MKTSKNRLLAHLHDNGPSMFQDLMRMPGNPLDTKSILLELKANDLITGDIAPGGTIRITNAGRCLYLAVQEERRLREKDAAKQVADKRADKRGNRIFEIFKILITAAITSVATLAVEHFGSILSFISH